MALFRNYEIQSNSVAHIDHKAGDKETGELIATETFVAILPCSQLTYAEIQIS